MNPPNRLQFPCLCLTRPHSQLSSLCTMRSASFSHLFLALSALLLLARASSSASASPLPLAVQTLLAPDWKNPGAWLTDFAMTAPDGSIYKRTTTPYVGPIPP